MNSKRLFWLDLIKIISTIFIVFQHGISSEWVEMASRGGISFFVLNFFFMLSRAAVPVFIMCSGYGMLKKSRDVKSVLSKNVLHLLITYVCWMLVFGIVAAFACPTLITKFNALVKAVLFGSYHTWFIFALICLYLITPFLQLFVNNDKLIRYFLILSVLFNVLIPYLWKIEILSPLEGVISGANMHFVTGYVMYYVAGFYLATIDITKFKKILSYSGLVISLVLGAALSYIASLSSGSDCQTVYTEFSLIGFIMCVSVFFTFRCLFENVDTEKPFVTRWVSLGIGIYLLHPIFNTCLTDHHGFQRILAILIVYVISLVINLLISLTPLKKLFLNG